MGLDHNPVSTESLSFFRPVRRKWYPGEVYVRRLPRGSDAVTVETGHPSNPHPRPGRRRSGYPEETQGRAGDGGWSPTVIPEYSLEGVGLCVNTSRRVRGP